MKLSKKIFEKEVMDIVETLKHSRKSEGEFYSDDSKTDIVYWRAYKGSYEIIDMGLSWNFEPKTIIDKTGLDALTSGFFDKNEKNKFLVFSGIGRIIVPYDGDGYFEWFDGAARYLMEDEWFDIELVD